MLMKKITSMLKTYFLVVRYCVARQRFTDVSQGHFVIIRELCLLGLPFSTQKMEAVRSSETSVQILPDCMVSYPRKYHSLQSRPLNSETQLHCCHICYSNFHLEMLLSSVCSYNISAVVMCVLFSLVLSSCLSVTRPKQDQQHLSLAKTVTWPVRIQCKVLLIQNLAG